MTTKTIPTVKTGPQPRQDIEAILHPRSVAVVGASTNPDKQGYTYVRLLREFGFKGGVYPVNPRAEEIAGFKCYPSLREVPRPLDYVISAVPAAQVPKLMEEAQGLGVKAVHFYTGRMADMGTQEGARAQREVVEAARREGIRLIGPNCMGVYVPSHGTSFRLNFPKRSGPVALISQSGGNAAEFVYRASLRGVFFSKVVSYGNASDLNESDFLEYLAHDPETRIIACYIEGVKDGRQFFKALSQAAQAKPVVVLKGGRTEAGTRAVASHTASMAGSVQVWDASLRQAGALRVDSMEEMADLVVAFLYLTPPRGRKVGVVCGGGGGTVHSADIFEAAGLQVPPLPEGLKANLKNLLPNTWFAASNPFDLSAVVSGDDEEETMPSAARLMTDSEAFDIVVLSPDLEFQLERPENQWRVHSLLDKLIGLKRSAGKPMTMIIQPGDSPEPWRWRTTQEAQQKAWEAGFPIYPSMARAANAIHRMVRYQEARSG